MGAVLPDSRRRWRVWGIVCAWLALAIPAGAQSLDAFDPRPDAPVRRIIVQPDQRVLIAGDFSVLGDQTPVAREKIARLNADGSVDTSFNPGSAIGAGAQVLAMALQPDGKVIVAGTGFANGRNILRLNANGSLDAGFTAAADDDVYALALQADGRIVVGGAFSTLSDASGDSFDRAGIGRFTANGTVDAAFDPGTNGVVRALLVQDDGRILVGGRFTTLGGGGTGATTRHNVGRIEATGAIDGTFDPGAGGHSSAMVTTFAIQPDGLILVGGRFRTLGGGGTGTATRNNLGRLLSNGAIDTEFVPELRQPSECTECQIAIVHSVRVLPSREILVGGLAVAFDSQGETDLHLARLDDDGELGLDFTASLDSTVHALTTQLDGRLLLGGEFSWEDFVVRSYLARVHPDTPEFQKLVAEDLQSGYQGNSTALSRDGVTAIIGAPIDIDSSGSVGASFIWTRDDPPDSWNEGPKLVGSGTIGLFIDQGWAVDISADGNTAIVGGPGDNNFFGAAWIWTRENGEWSEQTKLVPSGAIPTDASLEFGWAVALSDDGNTAIVGAPLDDEGLGAAWVWTRTGSTWTQQAKLVGTGAMHGDEDFVRQGEGVALSADGNTAMVGGGGDNDDVGAAWVFTRQGGAWTQQGSKLVGTGAVDDSRQGASVALSADGNTAIVGGPDDDDDLGAAWVWTRTAATWSQQGTKLVGFGGVGESVRQGLSVDISADGNTAVVGGADDDNNTGATWLWVRQNGIWSQRGGKFVARDALGPAHQGSSVGISGPGTTVITGGWADDYGIGAAWVFSTPAVTTLAATALTGASATLRATVTANGGDTAVSFEYGLTATYGRTIWVNPLLPPGLTAVPVSVPITGLQCGTVYHVRAIAARDITSYGADVTFTTVACPPDVVTLPVPVESITSTSAALPAQVNPNGAETTLSFLYGTTADNYDSVATVGSVGAGREPVTRSFTLTGLVCSTTYYYRARADNEGGTSLGAGLSFTTRPCPPIVTTLPVPAERRGPFSVVLEAQVNPNGLETMAQFDYGLTPEYGSASINVPVGAGTQPVSITVSVTGLTCGTTYFYRARAANASGTGNGAGLSFTTSACAPTITSITHGNGRLTVAFTAGADGGAPITHYEYSLNGDETWPSGVPASPASPLVITGLSNGSTYQVRLRAVNANYKGAASDARPGTPSTTPGPPAITAIAPGNGQLQIAFVPGDSGGMAIMNYDYSLDGGATWISRSPLSTGSPLLVTGLVNDATYPVRLRALNVNGAGDASAAVGATPRRAPDEAPDAFNPGANGEVTSVVVQADGKILVGGLFTRLGGATGTVPRNNLGRLNADGSVDMAFDPGRDLENPADNRVTALAVQHDGKILVAWDGPDPQNIRRRIGRLHPDGTVDETLTSAANGTVLVMRVQADGKILVGGSFTALGAWWNDELYQEPRHGIGRFNIDGSVDTTFDPGTIGTTVRALVQQPDGRILVGGSFSMLGPGGGVPRSNIARLNVDGSIDPGFDPGAGGGPSPSVRALSVIGSSIVVAGRFATLGGGGSGTTPRRNIGLLHMSGALDASFVPPSGGGSGEPPPVVEAVLLLNDQVLVGGLAVTATGAPRHLVRLNANGSIDTEFDPNPDGSVNALAIQPDGKIVVGGAFTSIGGSVRPRIARLGAPVPGRFTDDPIIRGVTPLRAVHIFELRAHVTALRLRFGLTETSWADPALFGVPVRATHIQQLRDALVEAYDVASRRGLNVTRPVFSDNPLLQGAGIRAAHIDELRAAVRTLEQQ
jgi:uncharacterized delta-60 repeat protein